MDAFHVWLRPLDGVCRVRVDGSENATWLIGRLGHSFIFKSSEPVRKELDTHCCTFQVPYSSQVSPAYLAKLLTKIPEVNLMLEPA
jgi:hypothetical protein